MKLKNYFEYINYCDKNNLNPFHKYNLELLQGVKNETPRNN